MLHSLERAAAGIGLHVNAHKTEYICFNQTGNISSLNSSTLKLVDKFTYQGSSVSSNKTDFDTRLAKAWTANVRISVIWKSDLTDKMKRSFFQVAIVSILPYGCTTRTLTKRSEKKLDSNYTRMLPAILNKSWRQHPTKQQPYGHLPPITETIKIRRTRQAGHSWRSWDELISYVLLCTDTGCSSEDLPKPMNNGEVWQERVRIIRADSGIWWWWHILMHARMHIYIYVYDYW